MALLLVVVVVGSALSIYNARYETKSIRRQAKTVFERFCDQIKRETELRGNRTVYGLKGLRGVFAASKSVERNEIKAYVDSRNLPKEFPGAIGMGYIKKVERKNLDEFVKAERADEFVAWRASRAEGGPTDHKSA